MRSFVRRAGRLTAAQERALRDLWPAWGIDYDTGELDLSAVFGRDAPRTLEIGFGNGEILVESAAREPEKDFLGIEVHEPGVGRVLMQIEKRELGNVRVICHDAVEVLRERLPAASLDQVNIFFPDPWPKKRHHKRRLIHPFFLALVARSMKPGARLHIATDWLDYAGHIHDCLESAASFRNTLAGGSLGDALQSGKSLRGETKFERRGRKLGHDIWDFVYEAAENPDSS